MREYKIEAEIEYRFTFPGLAEGEHETAYPTIEITYSYIAGRPAHTPRGEYAPIDPPDPAEVEFISAKLINVDGISPSQEQVNDWAERWLESDDGFNRAAYNAAELCADDAY